MAQVGSFPRALHQMTRPNSPDFAPLVSGESMFFVFAKRDEKKLIQAIKFKKSISFKPLFIMSSESKPFKKIYFGENTDDEFVIQGSVTQQNASISNFRFFFDFYFVTFSSEGFQKCLFRRCCCFILYIVTGGLGFLFLHWYKDWWLTFNAKQVPFYDADFLLVNSFDCQSIGLMGVLFILL